MRRALPLLLRRAAVLAALLLAWSCCALVVPARAADGWGWPLPGSPEVDRPFQPPSSPWGPGHRGVDLLGYDGEPVLSAGAGRVTYAGLLAGRGVVTVTHDDGERTTYEPVDATVSVGEEVQAGDRLGTLATGHASCRTGTVCLHWGLLRGSTYLDPLGLVVSGRLRLLPLAGDGSHADERRRRPRAQERERRRTQRGEREAEREGERTAERGAERRLGGRWTALRSSLHRVASHAGRLAARGARLVGRVAGRAGRLVARAVTRALPRLAARAAPYALRAAPYALDAVPYVAVGALVVGGVVWYVRTR